MSPNGFVCEDNSTPTCPNNMAVAGGDCGEGDGSTGDSFGGCSDGFTVVCSDPNQVPSCADGSTPYYQGAVAA